MRLFKPGTGTRMSVPAHMADRYLSQGWAQAGGYTVTAPAAQEPAEDQQDDTSPAADPNAAAAGVLTLSGAQVPDGTATDVIRWVGDDAQRARLALEAEQSRGDDARSTLVAKLTKLAGQ